MVTKIPRFAFEKFPQADSHLTTQMKSVGEVMAIGRTFQESFQKALRGLEVGVDGMNEKTQDREVLEKELGAPGPERIWYVGDAFALGMSVDEVFALTKIDPWFLVQIEQIVKVELELETMSLDQIDAATLRAADPRLIVCDISGYGNDGPYRDKKAYDLLIQSEAGFLSITGTPE